MCMLVEIMDLERDHNALGCPTCWRLWATLEEDELSWATH